MIYGNQDMRLALAIKLQKVVSMLVVPRPDTSGAETFGHGTSFAQLCRLSQSRATVCYAIVDYTRKDLFRG